MATIDIGQKEGAAVPLSQGELSNTMACAEVYFRTKWHLHPSSCLALTDMAKNWGQCTF